MEPGTSPNPPVNNQDEEQLRMLSIFFWIYAGLNAVGMCCLGGYFTFFGALFATAGAQGGSNAPPVALGGLFGGFGLILVLITGGFAFLHYSAGKALKNRSGLTVIYVAAGVACLSFPIGTALGVFTFVVLSRPSVKALFTS